MIFKRRDAIISRDVISIGGKDIPDILKHFAFEQVYQVGRVHVCSHSP